jgi:phage terminase large subunit-like protein
MDLVFIMSHIDPEYNGVQSWLLEYIDKCKSGEIVIGRELMAELDILLSYFNDPDIRIDFTEAHQRIKFIETQCRHSEAPFAGKPFLLELFQKAIIEAIYIFKIYDQEIYDRHTGKERENNTGFNPVNGWVRLYQDILLLIGRKEGKTPLVSAISLAEWFCGEIGTKILCSSNDYDQADLAFQAIDAMREQSPALEKVTRKNIKGIYFGNPKRPRKKGKYSYANKGSIRKISARTNAKEGKNIKVGMSDEVHELPDNRPIMPIRQALSTQDEPLYFELSTEGFTDEGYLDGRLKEARQVLKGELYRPRWLIWLYTQDSEAEVWQSETSWPKSNPGLGVIKKWSFLRQMVEEAKTNSATRAFVLAKDFNIKQNSATAWLTEADINNPVTFDPEILRGRYYIGGLDFAETTDLCNARALFYDKTTGKTYSLTMYFIPESKADAVLEDDNSANPEKKDYRAWAKQGLVTICPGDEVDPAMVVKWYYGLYENYKMLPYKQGFDNWHAVAFKKLYVEHFGEDILERIDMNFASLSSPMDLLETALKKKTLIYNDHEIDRWNLKNVSLKLDNIGRKMPVKKFGQSKNRIDGALGYMICYATLSRFKSEYMAKC